MAKVTVWAYDTRTMMNWSPVAFCDRVTSSVDKERPVIP